jgi:non-ribosomal peptide synthase protein (TIGR01720 family)
VTETARAYPLLPEQRRYLDRPPPDEHHWNIAQLFRIPAELTPEIARVAMTAVVNRHDGLRMHLREGDRAEFGVRAGPVRDLPFELIDLRGEPAADQAAKLTAECSRIQSSLSLTAAPLVRLAYFRLAGNECRLLVVIHHLVCDGLSLRIVLADLERGCRALLAGDLPTLPPVPVPASAYATWLTGVEVRDQLLLWRRIAAPATPVPVERSGANTMATADVVMAGLDRSTSATLLTSALPAWQAGTRDAVLAALAGVLKGTGADRDVRATFIGHGRRGLPGQPNLSRTVGWLSTRYPARIRVDTRRRLVDQIRLVRAQFSEIPCDGAGFGLLRYMSGDPRTRAALADLAEPEIIVNNLGCLDHDGTGGLFCDAPESAGPYETSAGLREFRHAIEVFVHRGRLGISWHYSTNQYERSTVEGYVHDILDRIGKAVTDGHW